MNNKFTKWFIMCVTTKYAQFNGRACRKEYWMYALMFGIIDFVPAFILGFIEGWVKGYTKGAQELHLDEPKLIIYTLINLLLLCPSLAVAIRRLHDTGRSGLFLLFSIIPFAIMSFVTPFLYMILASFVPSSGALMRILAPAVLVFPIPYPFPIADPLMLLALIATILVCGLYLLYLTVLDSTPGENKYGPNPKELQPLRQL